MVEKITLIFERSKAVEKRPTLTLCVDHGIGENFLGVDHAVGDDPSLLTYPFLGKTVLRQS